MEKDLEKFARRGRRGGVGVERDDLGEDCDLRNPRGPGVGEEGTAKSHQPEKQILTKPKQTKKPNPPVPSAQEPQPV